ncbi:MAG: ankyrin repeat domain-containing protein [Holosporaceae bacterium]|nr:ankyrin repeat domain-containing protein [Holosporaceae bacterium]
MKNKFSSYCLLSLLLSCGQENLDATNDLYIKSAPHLSREDFLYNAIQNNNLTQLHYAIVAGADVNATVKDQPLLHLAVEKGIVPTIMLIAAGANLNVRASYDTLLHTAVKCRKADIVKLLIALKMDVNAKGWLNYTPLINAIYNKDTKIEQMLRNAGAKINVLIHRDASILHMLAKGSSADWIKEFVQKGYDPNFRNKYGETPLYWAMNTPLKEANIKQLKALGAKADTTKPIHYAAHLGNEAIIVEELKAHPDMLHARDHHLNTPLHIAALEGHAKIVELLIGLGADPNALNRNGTPLHLAVSKGHIHTIKILLAHGAKLGLYNNDPEHSRNLQTKTTPAAKTPLHTAAAMNRIHTLKYLINIGANPNIQQWKLEKTPLCYAVENKNLQAIQILLGAGANPNIPDSYNSPLHIAIKAHDIPVLQALLASDKINTNIGSNNDYCSPPLCTAVAYGYLDMVELLLAKGANPNGMDEDGHSALRIALAAVEEENKIGLITRTLIRAGANVNLPTKKRNKTPLHTIISWSQNLDAITALLENGANLEVKENCFGNTAFHLLMKKPTSSLIQLLLDAGANVNAKNNNNITPLHLLMMERSNFHLIQLLLDAGADVNAKSNDNTTPLHLLTMNKPTAPQIELLLNAGADVNAKNNDNATPLHLIMKNQPTVHELQSLLNAGADVNAKDNNNMTPLHMLIMNKPNVLVVELLLDAGADINAKNNDNRTPLGIAYLHKKTKSYEVTHYVTSCLVSKGAKVH